MFYKFKGIRGLVDEQRGSLSVEAAMIVPLLVWGIVAMFTFFHAYKAQNAAYRANFTISDILSRETEEIGFDYLRGVHNVYQYMTFAETQGTWLRVSVVRCLSKCDMDTRNLDLVWSFGSNGARSLEQADFAHWEPLIPWLPKGDSLILLESSSIYTPLFPNFLVSFRERNLVSHSVTRPRFVSQLVWNGMNNGDDGQAQTDDSNEWEDSWGGPNWNNGNGNNN